MARADYRKSKGSFIFHNENPKNSLSAADCVVRAIAKGTNQTWDQVFKSLFEIAFKLKDSPNTKKTYGKYLKDIGYIMQKQPKNPDNTKLTVQEFINQNPEGTYICGTPGHLTVVVDGHLYDTWNCLDDVVGNYWEKI